MKERQKIWKKEYNERVKFLKEAGCNIQLGGVGIEPRMKGRMVISLRPEEQLAVMCGRMEIVFKDED